MFEYINYEVFNDPPTFVVSHVRNCHEVAGFCVYSMGIMLDCASNKIIRSAD